MVSIGKIQVKDVNTEYTCVESTDNIFQDLNMAIAKCKSLSIKSASPKT